MTNTETQPIGILAEARASRGEPGALTVAVAQLGGPWLDTPTRLAMAIEAASVASSEEAQLVVYPETYLSGYPFWLPRTDGAAFDEPDQKASYAYYLDAAIEIGGPEQKELETAAADLNVTLVVGVSERGVGLGSGTVWCTLLTIDPQQGLVGHHRKLVPTYDERLVWAHGDGAGLMTHPVGGTLVGGLNCWENWMPQARQSLYAQGETVHMAVWPGSSKLTGDITRFIAKEGRVFSIAAAGIGETGQISDDFPLADELRNVANPVLFNGGSCIAGPDGRWIIEPQVGGEGLLIADLDLTDVARERLNFDPTGHYSRPDVFSTSVDRRRKEAITFIDDESSTEGDV